MIYHPYSPVIELRPVKKNVGDLFKATQLLKGPALDVDEAIAEAVESADASTRPGRPS